MAVLVWITVMVTILVPSTYAQLDLCFPDELPEVPDPDLPKHVVKFSLSLFKKIVAAEDSGGRRRGREEGERMGGWRWDREEEGRKADIITDDAKKWWEVDDMKVRQTEELLVDGQKKWADADGIMSDEEMRSGDTKEKLSSVADSARESRKAKEERISAESIQGGKEKVECQSTSELHRKEKHKERQGAEDESGRQKDESDQRKPRQGRKDESEQRNERRGRVEESDHQEEKQKTTDESKRKQRTRTTVESDRDVKDILDRQGAADGSERQKRQRTPDASNQQTTGRSEQHRSGQQSLVFSPYSVWNALVMAYMGAEGKTRTELARALKLSSKMAAHANWQFVQRMLSEEVVGRRRLRTRRSSVDDTTLYQTFDANKPHRTKRGSRSSSRQELAASKVGGRAKTLTSTTRAYLGNHLTVPACILKNLPDIERIDFSQPTQAAERINAQVKLSTNGAIEQLVEPTDLIKADFMLMNAIYFKGVWETVFPEENTALETFRATPHIALDLVPMMRVVSTFKYVAATSLNASVIELPYTTGFTMLVLLPAMDVWKAEEVVKKLTYRKLETARMALVETRVEVSMPKFELSTKLTDQLKKGLIDLGIQDIFTGSANFNSFSNSAIHLDSAIQKATITVTEQGTTAAAATGLIGTRVGPIKFTADRPFVFLITDNILKVPVITGIYNGPN